MVEAHLTITRLLNPEEFGLLDGIPEPDRVKVEPERTICAASFDNGKLVGRLLALSVPHIECAWIDPDCRNGLVLGHMERLITKRLKSLGASLALAVAVDARMEDYVSRLGYTRLGTIWKKEI